MNEIVESARSARERLAAALALLQSPDAGNVIDTVAEPVARAMGALHSIESSGGQTVAEAGPLALASVRKALEALQAVPLSNVSLELAAAQVAGSLGMVHSLAQRAAPTAPAAAPTAAQPAKGFSGSPAQPSSPPQANFAKTAPSVAPPAEVNFAKTTPSVTPSMSAPKPVMTSVPAAPRGAGAFDKTAMASRSPVASVDPTTSRSVAPAAEAPVPAAASWPPAAAGQDSKHAPAPAHGPAQGTPVIEANLGAHSATNFYKGLSGNDVVVDGGLFVATYQIPPIGTQIWLKVTMPGGYDFEAGAQVRWSRDSGVGDSPPGFGAHLSAISPEARQLIHRYVKNREPLFHDDL